MAVRAGPPIRPSMIRPRCRMRGRVKASKSARWPSFEAWPGRYRALSLSCSYPRKSRFPRGLSRAKSYVGMLVGTGPAPPCPMMLHILHLPKLIAERRSTAVLGVAITGMLWAGIFRHRLLLAQLSAQLPLRQDQGRTDLRVGPDRRR